MDCCECPKLGEHEEGNRECLEGSVSKLMLAHSPIGDDVEVECVFEV